MSYRNLRKAVISKLGATRQAVWVRADKLRKGPTGPMSLEEAIAVIGHEAGLDVSQYLDPAEVELIRELVRHRAIVQSSQTQARPATVTQQVVKVNIAGQLRLSDPLLPRRVLEDAKQMAKVYAHLYVFENSVRELIKRRLSSVCGDNWWEVCVPRKIQKDAQKRIEGEGKNPWHGRRGAHPIHYSDLGDLSSIIVSNWSDFEDLFPEQSWITQKITEIARSRNVVNHHNPLGKEDQKRIRLYSADWHRQVQSVKDLLA